MPEDSGADRPQGDGPQVAPSISLPKGGGAIHGIGEKFAANPVTGTSGLSVPIATSPGRSGFGPELALSYDSGSGNGPFGFGWSLSLPAITRKTDKGLPRYLDEQESDVYIVSGAEDLVPVLGPRGGRLRDETTAPGYAIDRYRPRIEGLFARVERWTQVASGAIHWRSISRLNVTTLYGCDAGSRICDPADPSRVFSWLICASYDDKGNAITYDYIAEDDANVDLTRASERNRVRAANRYVKRIRYGNRTPHRDRATALDRAGRPTDTWMFEVVFDYDEGHYEVVEPERATPDGDGHLRARATPAATRAWPLRPDPFSSFRAGFEVRTQRRCRRVLMFHHIPAARGANSGYDGLVRSTEFHYADLDVGGPVSIDVELAHQGSTRFGSFLRAVTQSGYAPTGDRADTYLKKSLPALEFEYSKAVIQSEVRKLDGASLENLPEGLRDPAYQWVDLDGEGLSGVLTDQGGAWLYKANLGDGRFGPLQVLRSRPTPAGSGSDRQQLLDLAGDGQLDLVSLSSSSAGFYERTADGGWEPYRTFHELPNIQWSDPSVRLVDLSGDGHADVLVLDPDVLTWHPSAAEDGFGPAQLVAQPIDRAHNPRLVLADGVQSVYLADMSGDGLSDLVRIRNGDVCYWPNLGYGRFGAAVTMDQAPVFDRAEAFDQRRVRLADIDGSGTTDLIYLADDGPRLYFNQSGNRISDARRIEGLAGIDDLASVTVVDLLGSGTACLVWSSSLPGDARRPVRYVDLVGAGKPHLLVRSDNNLGATTRVRYAPSTRSYLADKRAGRPWSTRLPFPVHVVEQVISEDAITGNCFVSRYAYHDGHFDGVEREFRGFAMVEQWDTEELAALRGDETPATNIGLASDVPPVLTRTWYHTGSCLPGDEAAYYREPSATAAQARALLLEDSPLPAGLTVDERREALRALKGTMLRQETYALDGSDKQDHPYVVTEQSSTVRLLQPRAVNRHAVFLTYSRESVTSHYERDPDDPRVGHALTLEIDEFGNVLRSAAVGYGRRRADADLSATDQARQTQTLITCRHTRVTNAVDAPEHYRAPLTCETRTYELTGVARRAQDGLFRIDELIAAIDAATPLSYEQTGPDTIGKRLIGHERSYFRSDDLCDRLALGALGALAIPFETQRLALTAGLVEAVFADRARAPMLEREGGYAHSDGDADWWIPSGRVFYSADPADGAQQELAEARSHFFLPRRYRDPFHGPAASTETVVSYDAHDLLIEETRDALGNLVTVGERDPDPDQPLVRGGHDYRVLQPALIMDANRNLSELAFDALGLVAGMAVMGKPAPAVVQGDSLDGFRADLTQAEVERFLANPASGAASALLAGASKRLVYDVGAHRGSAASRMRPAAVATIARETHVSALQARQDSDVQIGISYSDGFGREIQRKFQAEPGALDDGGSDDVAPRWVGSGWTIFNNKGKPVRQYEPFFTRTHEFEFDARAGVSQIVMYDALGRVLATLHPDHTWQKVVFDPWRQEIWDASDTLLVVDPAADDDVGRCFCRLPTEAYLPTWHALRADPRHAAQARRRWPDGRTRAAERAAAEKAAVGAGTPTVAHADALGRTILAITHNASRYSAAPPDAPPAEEQAQTTIVLDILGNQRAIVDPCGRVAMTCDVDLLGNRIHQASIDAGARWILNDVSGRPLYAWDSREREFRFTFDALRRPRKSLLRERGGAALVVGESIYGEDDPRSQEANLRGRVLALRDQAGVVTTSEYDFKGNALSTRRQLARSYRTTVDWSAAVVLDEAAYVTSTRYDAMNRPIQLIAPHEDGGGAVNVVQPVYNAASLLERVHVWLDRDEAPLEALDPASADLDAVTGIDYNPKGQRRRIDYGNGVSTSYQYDPATFRLVRLLSRRRDAVALQDLRYTYDPLGNITHARDDSQDVVFFRNARVDPSADYTYDALSRLIEATGREHLGQIGGAPIPHRPTGAASGRRRHPGDGQALGRYLDRYVYDAVGNVLSMRHAGSDPASPGWTRTYRYDEPSLIEPTKRGDRLTSTALGDVTERLSTDGDGYDAHGSMLRMAHLPAMRWDFRDQLRMSQRTAADGGSDEAPGPGQRTWYVYDAAGQRVRKVRESGRGRIRDERIYLGGVELYRRHGSKPQVREQLHVMDDKHRVALVETRRRADESATTLVRYQLTNHLGSTTIELDARARVISFEEYAPYGSTTFHSVRTQREAPKRYRYSGKERDDESGLYYYGARYYAPWLGRWTSTDPKGLVDGTNLYAYARANPIVYADPSGTQCDPTMECCVDPTAPTPREDALAQSLPEEERNLPPPASAGNAATAEGAGGGTAPAAPEIHPDNFAVGRSGVRLRADVPRAEYRNFVAQDMARAGHYRLAEIAEAGHGCAFCHIVKEYSTYAEANAAVDLRHYNRVAEWMAFARDQVAITVVLVPAAAALTPVRAAAAGEGAVAASEGGVALAEGGAAAGSEMVTVYRGTRHVAELEVLAESGHVMSDAARIAYLEARYAGATTEAALGAARTASEAAHATQLRAWGSLRDYAQAHGAFGTEISAFGSRSMISWTTNPTVAARFAGSGGQVISATVPRSMLIPQTLEGAAESEMFILHLLKTGGL